MAYSGGVAAAAAAAERQRMMFAEEESMANYTQDDLNNEACLSLGAGQFLGNQISDYR